MVFVERQICAAPFGPASRGVFGFRYAKVAMSTIETRPIDWAAVSRETIAHLQRLIRINTVNPPGNEIVVAQYLEATLSAEGIETHLFEPAPGRAAVVAERRRRDLGSALPRS